MRADLARLQGEKAEAEARVERERSEKNKALLEKEQFRAHVHHLARALRVSQSASQPDSQPASQSILSIAWERQFGRFLLRLLAHFQSIFPLPLLFFCMS